MHFCIFTLSSRPWGSVELSVDGWTVDPDSGAVYFVSLLVRTLGANAIDFEVAWEATFAVVSPAQGIISGIAVRASVSLLLSVVV